MSGRFAPVLGLVVLLGWGAAAARGQVVLPGIVTCDATSSVPLVDASSLSERTGEIILTCRLYPNSVPPPGPQRHYSVNLSVTFNSDIKPKQVGETGPVAIVQENVCPIPAIAGGVFGSCGALDPRFQDPQLALWAADNRIEWKNLQLPIPEAAPPGEQPNPHVVTVRLAGLRGNPSQIHDGATPISAFISTGGATLIPVTNNVLNVALPVTGAASQAPPPVLTPTFDISTCASTTTVPTVQAEGLAELVGDVILTCTRPDVATPTGPTAQMHLGLRLNTDVKNAVGGGNLTNARLIINENDCPTAAATGSVFGSCGAADSRFQDPQKGVLVAPDRLLWQDVAFPMPGASDGSSTFPSVTTIRLTGVKADIANLVGPGPVGPSQQVIGDLTITGTASVGVNQTRLALANPVAGAPSNQTSPDPRFGVTTCQVTAVPPVVRAEGIAELGADIVFACTNPSAPTDPNYGTAKMELSVALNTPVTNNVSAGAAMFADAVLVINENNCINPNPAGSRFGCGYDPRFQEAQYARKVADNRLLWSNVSFPIPGALGPTPQYPFTTTIRLTGIRFDASSLGVPNAATFPGTQVTAFVSFSGEATAGLSTTTVNMAVPILGLISSGVSEITGLQCTDDSKVVETTLTEGFATAWKSIGMPTYQPSNRQWESGYFAPPSNNGGGVTQATRILLRFFGVPDGVTAEVPDQVLGGGNFDLVDLRLVNGADTNGAGGAVGPPGSGSTEVDLSNGSGLAVYEVFQSDPFRIEEVVIAVTFSWTSDAANNLPAAGVGEIAAMLGPISDIHTASNPAPEPRFVDLVSVQPNRKETAITIERCTTTLLFPYATNQSGQDTRIAIANPSGLIPGVPAQPGACTMHYHGSTSGGGAAPADQTSNPIASGELLNFTLSAGAPAAGIAGAPDFGGYLMAVCDFLGAQGTAVVDDGAGRISESVAEVAASGAAVRAPDSRTLLFPFASNQSGLDTEIVVSNTTEDWLGTSPEIGACAIDYFGVNAPPTQFTPNLAGGEQVRFALSQGAPTLGIAGAPGFEGFIEVSCGFSLARGSARVIGSTPDAYAYAAEPMQVDPPAASPAKAEGTPQVEQSASNILLYKRVAANNRFDSTLTLANFGLSTAECLIDFRNRPGLPPASPVQATVPPGGFYQTKTSAHSPNFAGMVTATCDQPDVVGAAILMQTIGQDVTVASLYHAEPVSLPRSTTPEPFVFSFLEQDGLIDRQITITNTTGDGLGTPAQNGTCTVRHYGGASDGGPAPADKTLSIPAGQFGIYSLRELVQQAGSPNFTGFGVADCDFPLARGFNARRELVP